MADGKGRDLILKYLRDELSAFEYNELQEWINSSSTNKQVLDELADPEQLQQNLLEFHLAPSRVRAKLDALIQRESQDKPTPSIAPSRSRAWLYAAAACLILLVTTAWLFHQQHTSSPLAAKTPPVQDIAPGGNKALLTLANGSTIVLEHAGNGALVKQGYTAVSKDSNRLSYATSVIPTPSTEVLYNVLTTPRAGQYQLLLPDGTKVFLNNASSLRYPTAFSGKDRQVTLSGEAFFVVAKDASKPFIVNTDRLSIHVLGTSFDVMAYADERNIKTTLISGAVSLQSSSRQLMLHPGEQAAAAADGALSAYPVDADETIAWTRGYFHFTHESIEDVLRQLTRWYDVSVDFAVPVPGYVYDGEIGRDLSLATILKHLEKPDLHFRIEGRKLIVTN